MLYEVITPIDNRLIMIVTGRRSAILSATGRRSWTKDSPKSKCAKRPSHLPYWTINRITSYNVCYTKLLRLRPWWLLITRNDAPAVCRPVFVARWKRSRVFSKVRWFNLTQRTFRTILGRPPIWLSGPYVRSCSSTISKEDIYERFSYLSQMPVRARVS